MTNLEIIVAEAIANKIYTEEEALTIIAERGALPIHTFAAWKALGYSVKKGEHARITTRLWKFKKEKVTMENTDGETVEQDTHNYYLCKAFLFTAEQVEKIEKGIA